MNNYLREFSNVAEYDAATINRPNVSLIGDTMGVIYNPIPEGFVDLGLPSKTLWAKYNLGATHEDTAESWYGNYFAWGETTEHAGWDEQGTKIPYDWENYALGTGSWAFDAKVIKYCRSLDEKYWGGEGTPDNILTLDSENDPITIALGRGFHSPTEEQVADLFLNPNEWVTDYDPGTGAIPGLNGRIVYKIIINSPAFIAEGISLYINLLGTIEQVSENSWFFTSRHTLSELNIMISTFTSGEVTDIRTVIFKDPEGQILAIYGVDYEFADIDVDTSVNIFIPASGFRENSRLTNQGEGYLWTSGLEETSLFGVIIGVGQGHAGSGSARRNFGLPVRAVIG